LERIRCYRPKQANRSTLGHIEKFKLNKPKELYPEAK
jgi:hypothetical protein